jgi:hypothetical protein
MRRLSSAVAMLTLGCPLTAFDRGLETPAQAGTAGGIGCQACAIAMVVEGWITDDRGAALSDVEVWWVPALPKPFADEDERTRPVIRANRLGVTNVEGHLLAPECLMGELEFRMARPGPTVRLEFLLFREGFGASRVVREVPTKEVLQSGYVLGKPMGHPLKNGYIVKLTRALARVK